MYDLISLAIAVFVAILFCKFCKKTEYMDPMSRGPAPSPVAVSLVQPSAVNYRFYPTYGFPGNNIRQDTYFANNIDALKRACSNRNDCVGFMSDGSLKYMIPPSDKWHKWTTQPNAGLYVKMR
jgi:hypothetical protein